MASPGRRCLGATISLHVSHHLLTFRLQPPKGSSKCFPVQRSYFRIQVQLHLPLCGPAVILELVSIKMGVQAQIQFSRRPRVTSPVLHSLRPYCNSRQIRPLPGHPHPRLPYMMPRSCICMVGFQLSQPHFRLLCILHFS